jgi:hypothetical protein
LLMDYICDHVAACENIDCHWHEPHHKIAWRSLLCETAGEIVLMVLMPEDGSVIPWPSPADMPTNELRLEMRKQVKALHTATFGPQALGRQHAIQIAASRIKRLWPELDKRADWKDKE